MAWLPNVEPQEPAPDIAMGQGLGPLLKSLSQQIPPTTMDPMPMMATHPFLESVISKFMSAAESPSTLSKSINKTAVNQVIDYIASITHDPEPYTKLRGIYSSPVSSDFRGVWNPYSAVSSPESRQQVTDLLNRYHAKELTPVGSYRNIPNSGAEISLREDLFRKRGDDLLQTMIHEFGHHRQGFSEKPFGAYEYVRKYPKIFNTFGHSGIPDEAVADLYSYMERGQLSPKNMVMRSMAEQSQKEIPFGSKINRYETDSDWQNWLQQARKVNWFIDPKDPEQTRKMLIGLLADENRGYQAANVIAKQATGKPLASNSMIATRMKRALGDQTMESVVRANPNAGYGPGLLDFLLRAGVE